MIIRDELEIVYATLKSVVSSFPQLEEDPRFVFDYDPEDVLAGPYPTVGIRRFSDLSTKLIDKNEDYVLTTMSDKCYAWYEVGRFNYGVTVGLFMNSNEDIPNPMPFLRKWQSHISKLLLQQVRFKTVYDVLPNEFVQLTSTANPFEQQGKLLYSIKLSINATGKLLTATELREPTHDSPPGKWKIHADPKVFE